MLKVNDKAFPKRGKINGKKVNQLNWYFFISVISNLNRMFQWCFFAKDKYKEDFYLQVDILQGPYVQMYDVKELKN